jgi:hypothetical protein
MCSARAGHVFVELSGTNTDRVDARRSPCGVGPWNDTPRSAFLFRLESQEHAMPYLFWAVLPFALMDTWWGMCEQRRDTE